MRPLTAPSAPLRHQPGGPLRAGIWLMLGLGVIAAVGWQAGSDRVVGQVQALEKPVNIYRGQSVGEQLVLPRGDLHRVDVMLVNYGEVRHGSLELSVLDEHNVRLGQASIDSARVRETWTAIELDRPVPVGDRPTRLVLSRDSSWREPIGVRVGPGDRHPGEGIYRDALDGSLDLVFRAHVSVAPTPLDRLARLGEVASTLAVGRPGAFGAPGWVLGLGALVAAASVALVWLSPRLVPAA